MSPNHPTANLEPEEIQKILGNRQPAHQRPGYFQRLKEAVMDLFTRPKHVIERRRNDKLSTTRSNREYQSAMRTSAANLRILSHRQSCLQGYEHKRRLVAAGKGRNTMGGVPTRP